MASFLVHAFAAAAVGVAPPFSVSSVEIVHRGDAYRISHSWSIDGGGSHTFVELKVPELSDAYHAAEFEGRTTLFFDRAIARNVWVECSVVTEVHPTDERKVTTHRVLLPILVERGKKYVLRIAEADLTKRECSVEYLEAQP